MRLALLLLSIAALAAHAQTCTPASVPNGIYFKDGNDAGLLTVNPDDSFVSEQFFDKKLCALTLSGTFSYDNATGTFTETISICAEDPVCSDPPVLCDQLKTAPGAATYAPIPGQITFDSAAKTPCTRGTVAFQGGNAISWRSSSTAIIASIMLIAVSCLALLL